MERKTDRQEGKEREREIKRKTEIFDKKKKQIKKKEKHKMIDRRPTRVCPCVHVS